MRAWLATRRRPCLPRLAVAAASAIALTLGGSLAWLVFGGGAGAWNVLLVTLDTTRADHLGAYGYAHADTPAIDALAAQGVRYARCYSAAPLTLPSHATILTGLLPPRHGVHANGVQILAEEAVTLAEILAGQGYRTGAVVAAFVLDGRFGLRQGFQHYDDDLAAGSRPSRYGYAMRDARQVTDAALSWLREKTRRPFFLWVHYFDPHAPYEPPGFDPASLRVPYRTPYDAEIEFVDSQLKRLLDFLGETGAAERTLVVLSADHGEALWDHGELTHGLFAYDATLLVPLIVRFPDQRLAGTAIAEPVSLADLMPGVLTWIGRAVPEGLDGRPLRLEEDGAADAAPGDQLLYFENEGPAHLFGWSPLRGVVAGRHKLIRAPEPELYDLLEDPYETQNLYHPEEARSRALLERFQVRMEELEALPRLGAAEADLSEESRARLRALHYADAGDPSPGPGSWRHPRGTDPKRMVPVYHKVETALSLIDQERVQEGVEILLEVVTSDDPGNRRALSVLADLAANDEAARPRAIEGLWDFARRGSADRVFALSVRFRLGVALAQEQRFAEAIEALRLAQEIDPARPLVHYHLGLAYEASGRPEEAREELRRALDLAPDGTSEWLEDARRRIASLETRP